MVEQTVLSAKLALFGGVPRPVFTRLMGVELAGPRGGRDVCNHCHGSMTRT